MCVRYGTGRKNPAKQNRQQKKNETKRNNSTQTFHWCIQNICVVWSTLAIFLSAHTHIFTCDAERIKSWFDLKFFFLHLFFSASCFVCIVCSVCCFLQLLLFNYFFLLGRSIVWFVHPSFFVPELDLFRCIRNWEIYKLIGKKYKVNTWSEILPRAFAIIPVYAYADVFKCI